MAIDFASALDIIDSSCRLGCPRDISTHVAHTLGFRWFHYHCRAQADDVTNGPARWHERYQSADYNAQDPLRRRTRRLRKVVAWQQGKSFPSGDAEMVAFVEESASHGAASGVNIPIFAGFGREAFLCFSGERQALGDPGDYDNPVLYTIGARLDQLFLTAEREGANHELTTQERLCLGWISRGKTMSEAAAVIGIQRRTVEFHLTNARRKLNAVTVPHAIAEAIRGGLIH